jgi:hypothetical protein
LNWKICPGIHGTVSELPLPALDVPVPDVLMVASVGVVVEPIVSVVEVWLMIAPPLLCVVVVVCVVVLVVLEALPEELSAWLLSGLRLALRVEGLKVPGT